MLQPIDCNVFDGKDQWRRLDKPSGRRGLARDLSTIRTNGAGLVRPAGGRRTKAEQVAGAPLNELLWRAIQNVDRPACIKVIV